MRDKHHKANSGYDEFNSSGESGGKLGAHSMEAIITLPIGNSLTDGGKKLGKPTRADYSKLLSSTYAILIVLIGILFPMTEALHDKWHMTIYNMIYVVYTLSLSSMCIVYLQWILLREHQRHHKAGHRHGHSSHRSSKTHSQRRRSSAAPDFKIRETKHGILIEEEPSDNTGSDQVSNHTKTKASYEHPGKQMSSSTLAQQSASGSSHPPMYTKNGSKTSAYGGISAKLVFGSTTNLTGNVGGSQHMIGSASPAAYDLDFNGNRRWMSADDDEDRLTDYSNDNQQDQEHVWIDLSKLGSVFSHEGSSLYLRMGELIFTVGNVIYIALEIEFSLNPDTASCSGTFSWTFFFRLVFILLQTFFLFKNRSMHTTEQGAWVRFALMHLIATNVSVWLRTLCNEIMNEYDHFTHLSPHAVGESSNSSSSDNCYDTILSKTLPYLFPFVLEYSLIAMGTLAIMYAEVDTDHDDRTNALRGLKNLFKVQALEKSSGTDADSIASDDSLLQTLTKSHRGLFAGVIVLAGGFIAVLLFYLGPSDSQIIVYLATDCSLHSLMLVGTILALVQLHELSYIARPLSVDDVLLIVSMFGAVLYELSIQMASGYYIANYSDAAEHSPEIPSNHSALYIALYAGTDDGHASAQQDSFSIEILRLCSSMIACLQSVLQLMLTLSALRRYPSKQRHLTKMPGRGVVTLLIICNVTVWICRSCLIKVLSPSVQLDYYGTITWLLLLNINLPLLLFFRFHSSVCLADVWHTAYTSPFHASHHEQSEHVPRVSHGGSPLSSSSMEKITHSVEAHTAGVSTLIKSYSMSHLTPPTTSRSFVARMASATSGRSSAVPMSVSRLPHIEDVEDVEDIANDFQPTALASDMRF